MDSKSKTTKTVTSILCAITFLCAFSFLGLTITVPKAYAATVPKAYTAPVHPFTEVDPCIYVNILLSDSSVVNFGIGVAQKYRVRLYVGNGCGVAIPAGKAQWDLPGNGECDSGQTFLISNHTGYLPALAAHSAPKLIDASWHETTCNVYENNVLIAQVLPVHISWYSSVSYSYRVGNINIMLTGSASRQLY